MPRAELPVDLDYFVCTECGSAVQEVEDSQKGEKRFLFDGEYAAGERPRVHTVCVGCSNRKVWKDNCVYRSYKKKREAPEPRFAETNADVTLMVEDGVECALCGANKDTTPGHGIFVDRVDNVSLIRRYTCRTCKGAWVHDPKTTATTAIVAETAASALEAMDAEPAAEPAAATDVR